VRIKADMTVIPLIAKASLNIIIFLFSGFKHNPLATIPLEHFHRIRSLPKLSASSSKGRSLLAAKEMTDEINLGKSPVKLAITVFAYNEEDSISNVIHVDKLLIFLS
jgi:hypothetical protein